LKTKLAVIAALAATGCKKRPATTTVTPESGSAVGSATPVTPHTETTPAPASAALSPTALDDALASKSVQRDDVIKRADTPHSQWAVVNGSPGSVNTTSYVVWRALPSGTSMLELTLPESAAFDDVTGIDVQDVDKDGVDDAVITATWQRSLEEPRGKGHTLQTTEHVEQMYVVGGAKLAVGAQHARDYKTETNLGPDENAQPEEAVAFTTSVLPGPPPVLRAIAGEASLQPNRIKGLLDPGKDPLLKAGDVPIGFK